MWWLILALIVVTYYFLRYPWELVQLPKLSKRAVFITGADSGFGYLLALKCAANGLPVFAGCLTEEGIANLMAKEEKLSGSLHALPLDVRDKSSVVSAVEYVREHLAGGEYLWAVVSNAGVIRMSADAWSDMSDIYHCVDVNCYGTIRVTHVFLPMLKKSRGRIISVSSICGRYSLPGASGYCISKYGVEAYMDSIRRELKPFGIRCSILEPGGFRTGIMTAENTRKHVEDAWSKVSHDLKEEYGEKFKENMIQGIWQGWDRTASNRLNFVVDAYYHAITARWPRNRYRCGWEALFTIPIAFLPTELEDLALRYLRGSENVPACLEQSPDPKTY